MSQRVVQQNIVPLLIPGDLVDEREAAEILRIGRQTLANWRANGGQCGPRFVKIGKRLVRYRRSDLQKFVDGGGEPT